MSTPVVFIVSMEFGGTGSPFFFLRADGGKPPF